MPKQGLLNLILWVQPMQMEHLKWVIKNLKNVVSSQHVPTGIYSFLTWAIFLKKTNLIRTDPPICMKHKLIMPFAYLIKYQLEVTLNFFKNFFEKTNIYNRTI